MKKLSNKEIIDKYLKRFEYSPSSKITRMYALQYFFNKEFFGYSDHIFEIKKNTLLDYFDYLNNSEVITLTTKKNKWILLKSFIQYCMEYYDEFTVTIPKHSIKWKGENYHKKSLYNKNVVLEIKQIKFILNYFKLTNFKHYLIYRTLIETGMRKKGLRNINIERLDDISGKIIHLNDDLNKRMIITIEKQNKTCVYYISSELSDLLKMYLDDRNKIETKTKAFFLSHTKNRINRTILNELLHRNPEIKKMNVSPHTFRRTINTLRKKMGCIPEDRKILLNHSVPDVNYRSYTKLKYKDFIELYDKWNPYKTIIL